MEFRILGPLEVLENGRQVDLGGAKQRALLAVLLLHANEVVSTDRLIDALWEEDAPETGRKALQVYVSQLRKALGKERIATRSPGYRLQVERDELDLARFQRLLEEGKPREALSLWRGPPLADFAFERFAHSEIARLEDLRLAGLEDRIEADLGIGRHAALVGELEAIVRQHPLRERLRAQLMLALYRSGRQAEALEAYQDARQALVEELGIEPGRALRELQQAILQQDDALDVEIAVERSPDARPPDPAPRPIAPDPTPELRAERKTVTAVHVRVAVAAERGDQLDPEVLRRVLTRAFGVVTDAVEAHEGTIETTSGDAVTAVFGLPHIHEDDARRAVRAADEIQSRVAEGDWPAPLDVRIGVATGSVVTGGDPAGLQLRATGEPLTASARLAQEGEPGETAMDETTRRSAQAAERERGRFASPMVGRTRERRRLNDAFEQAVGDNSCQLFTVLGTAGVGKSRLIQEFLEDIAQSAVVARGRCLPYGEGITFWPLLEAIKDVAELDDAAPIEENRARLAELVDEEAEPELVAQRLTEILGMAEARAGIEERFEAVRKLVEALGRRHALVVVFDDIHWAESTFLDLVEHLADWSRGAPILLLCMARPELLEVRPSWAGGKLNATTVLLEPLSNGECMELVSNLVGGDDAAGRLESRIAEAAEGNPLFVEEMVSMLIDDGLLVAEDGHWAVVGDLAAVPVPPTIHALLAARLDQLGNEERAVLEQAAVEGKLFHRGSVEQLSSGAGRSLVPTQLGALIRKELIRPDKPVFAGEDAYRFRHLLIRDAAYGSIPKSVRADLHERHAAWLQEKANERGVEYDEILGYHLEQAYRFRAELGEVDEESRTVGRRAAERLGAAGKRAFARLDAPAAMNLMSRATALLPSDDPLRVDLIPNVRAIQGAADLGWADAILQDAIASGDPRLNAHALVQRGFLSLFFHDSEVTAAELIDIAEDAIAVFEVAADELGLARAWRLVAQSHYLAREGRLSAEAAETALEFARRSGDRFEQQEILEWLGIALVLGPTTGAEGAAICGRLLDQFAGDPRLELILIGTLAYMVGIQGRTSEAEQLVTEGRQLAERLDETAWLFPVLLAFKMAWLSDPVSAERNLRPLYEGLKGLGEQSHFCSVSTMLAKATYEQGRYDEADELSREAERSSRPNDVHSHIVWRGTRAKVLARRGDFEAAEKLAREAVAYAEASDFLHSHADALTDLAEVLALAGRPEESASAIEPAIRLHEAKGNVLAVAHTRTFLHDLRRTNGAHADGGGGGGGKGVAGSPQGAKRSETPPLPLLWAP
ncbi:MAG: BTAD domain-containing putative transcriptional regulator, partial [Gaiellaceae bacterium]